MLRSNIYGHDICPKPVQTKIQIDCCSRKDRFRIMYIVMASDSLCLRQVPVCLLLLILVPYSRPSFPRYQFSP